MNVLVVDPYTLELPEANAPAREAWARVALILDHLKTIEVLRRAQCEIRAPDVCLKTPRFEHLSSLARARNLIPALRDSGISVDFLCQRTQRLRALLEECRQRPGKAGGRIPEVLHEDASLLPECFQERLCGDCSERCRSVLSEEFVRLASCRVGTKQTEPAWHAFVSRAGGCPHPGHSEISVEATVHELETEIGDRVEFAPPLFVKDTVPVFMEKAKARLEFGWERAYGHAETDVRIRAAIDIAAEDRVNQQPVLGHAPLKYALGKRFRDTVDRFGFSTDRNLAGSLVGKCARIVANLPVDKKVRGKAFRVAEGNPRQLIRRDGAHAWEVHLTKRGPGFRLLYWRIPGPKESIEFANVGAHEDQVIE